MAVREIAVSTCRSRKRKSLPQPVDRDVRWPAACRWIEHSCQLQFLVGSELGALNDPLWKVGAGGCWALPGLSPKAVEI